MTDRRKYPDRPFAGVVADWTLNAQASLPL